MPAGDSGTGTPNPRRRTASRNGRSAPGTAGLVSGTEAATVVTAELVCNPLTGAPVRSKSSLYEPRYPDMLLKFFADLLEAPGAKLADSEVEETRTIAEKPKREDAQPEEDGKDPSTKPMGRPPGRPAQEIVETRKVRRKEWKLVCAEIPTFAKFGRVIGVSTDTMKRWRAQYPSWDEACNMAVDMGADALVQRGLRGQYDPEMVKFVTKNWYGMVDRQELTGADGAPLNPPVELRSVSAEVLDAAYAGLLELKQKLLEAGKQQG